MLIPPFARRDLKSERLGRRKGRGGDKTGASGVSGKAPSGGTGRTPHTGHTGSKPSSGTGGTSTGSKSYGGTGGTPAGGKSSSRTGTPPSAGKTSTVPLSTSTADGKTSAVAYGLGGGRTIIIPSGEIFGGRSAGGGLRSQIYGSSTYGSGYPGIAGRGVAGRGFPFWYWPVVWHGAPSGSYLQAPEYGNPSNDSRVGGPMAEATFVSSSETTTTFHILSDNSTVASLVTSIDANCSSYLAPSSSTSPQPYNASAPGAPQPEQAIQYYRASSIVLTLDGYNNSATLSSDPSAPNTPLPSSIDTALLDCLNQTIGASAPLISGTLPWSTVPSGASLLGLVWFVWCILLQ